MDDRQIEARSSFFTRCDQLHFALEKSRKKWLNNDVFNLIEPMSNQKTRRGRPRLEKELSCSQVNFSLTQSDFMMLKEIAASQNTTAPRLVRSLAKRAIESHSFAA